MPRKVQFEGRTYTFPDDATDKEVSEAISGAGSVNITHKPYDPQRGARLNDRPAPLQPAGVPEGETADYAMGQASRSIRNLGTAALPAMLPYMGAHPISTVVGGVAGGAAQQGVQALGETLGHPGAGELGGDVVGAATGLLAPKIPAVGAYKFLRHPKTAISKLIMDAVLEGVGKGQKGDAISALDYMKTKPTGSEGFEPFGSKPVLPPLTSDVQSRLNSLPPISINDVNSPPEPGIPYVSPRGNTGVTVNFGVKWPNELWVTVRDAVIDNPHLGSRVAELVRSKGRDMVTARDIQGALSARPPIWEGQDPIGSRVLPTVDPLPPASGAFPSGRVPGTGEPRAPFTPEVRPRTPLWRGMPDADSGVATPDPIGPVAFPSGRVPGAGIPKPSAPPPAAQPATSPIQPQGPIQTPPPTPIQPIGESMPQNTVMGGAEAHRYAHAQAQAAELPGSPAGTRAGAHDALTAIAKAKYGKNAWHELAPAQMQEIGDWLLDINMQKAQRQGIPPVK